MFFELILLSLLSSARFINAEIPPVGLPDPSTCIGDLANWEACDAFVAKTVECLSKPTQEEKDTCPCNEEYWNTITSYEHGPKPPNPTIH